MVTTDKLKVLDKMVHFFNDCKDSNQPVSDDETWCVATEASVVSGDSGNYYRHHWKIDEFEV